MDLGEDMNKIVFFGWKPRSNFYITEEVMKYLIKNGIEVHYFGFQQFKERVEKMGAIFYEYSKVAKRNIEIEGNTQFDNNIEFFIDNYKKYTLKMLSYYKEVYINDLEEVKKINPDLIFRDWSAINGKFIACKLKKKCIGINTLISILEEDIAKNPIELFSLYNSINIRLFNGYDKRKFFEEFIGYNRKITLDMDIPYVSPNCAVDGQDDINISFGGSLIQKSCVYNGKKYYVAKHLAFNKEGKKNTDSLKDIIYVSTGSTISYEKSYYNKILASLMPLGYKIIMSIPNLKNISNKLPNNVIIENWVNQKEILKRTKFAITTGGLNTICECINNNVPMIINPIMNDQTYNAYKMKELGIAEIVDIQSMQTTELTEYISEFSNCDFYKKNIEKVRGDFYDSPYLESILNEIINEGNESCDMYS